MRYHQVCRLSVLRACAAYLTTASTGFDGSLMGGINAMEQYLQYFHYKEVGASTGISECLSPPSPHPAIARPILLAR